MRKHIALGLLFICLAAALSALGNKEEDAVVQVTGRVRLVGSGPMPEIVISGQERQWYVAKEDSEKLKQLQHRTVTVEGKETVAELKFASGRSAGTRRTLSDIKIIKVE